MEMCSWLHTLSVNPHPSWCYEVMTRFQLGCFAAQYYSCPHASQSYRCFKTPFTLILVPACSPLLHFSCFFGDPQNVLKQVSAA